MVKSISESGYTFGVCDTSKHTGVLLQKIPMMKTIIHTPECGRSHRSFCSSPEQNRVPVSGKRKPASEHDTYPALSRREIARRRAHQLLDREPNGESKPVRIGAQQRAANTIGKTESEIV